MKPVLDWVDDRTGIRSLCHTIFCYPIPGGAKWRYIWGSLLGYGLLVQLITGIFLWMCYSPSQQTAWESVSYIQHQMPGGWLLRGIHHYMASFMVVLLGIHVVQVILWGAYKAPREVTFWTGLILLQLILVLSLTGYLLPWDQRGFRATTVATNLSGLAPVVGPYVKQVAVGGTEFNHHTLTRFFALHAGVLPLLTGLVVLIHIALVRRHGLHRGELDGPAVETTKVGRLWPDHAARVGIGALVMTLLLIGMVVWEGGAELGPPADPNKDDRSSRPEWYFLFLFHTLRKYTTGELEIVGALVIPGAVMTLLALMPFIGRTKIGHKFNVVTIFALLGVVAFLSAEAVIQDRNDPIYMAAVKRSHEEAKIYAELSLRGIPQGGPQEMAKHEPRLQGPKLFAQHCASCHRVNGHDGLGFIPKDKPSAFDLGGFASRAYLTAMLDPARAESSHFFGSWQVRTKDDKGNVVSKTEAGEMLNFVKSDVAKYDAAKQAQLAKGLKALSAEAALPAQAAVEAQEKAILEEGRALLAGDLSCTDCHKFREAGDLGSAPDLTGYGSAEWLDGILRKPAHERFYAPRYEARDDGGEVTLMPAYGEGDSKLSDLELKMLVDWLRLTKTVGGASAAH